VVNATARPHYPMERPGTHCIRSWFWTGAEYLAPTRMLSPDRLSRSESLHDRATPGWGYEDVVFESRERKRVAGAKELIFHLTKIQGS